MPKLIRGLSAFPITPQSADGVVDLLALRHLVQRLIDAEVESIGLLGSTGTYAFLSRAERRRAVQAAVDCIADAKKAAAGADATGGRGGGGGGGGSRSSWPVLLVSVSHVRTDRAILLARDALECGADAGLLSPISYNPLTEREVAAHYAAVAGAVPGLPLVIYDNPSTTKFTFSPALVGRLARELPTVVGLKTSSPATQARTCTRSRREGGGAARRRDGDGDGDGWAGGNPADTHTRACTLGEVWWRRRWWWWCARWWWWRPNTAAIAIAIAIAASASPVQK
jgi:dihydrodipicolinate synthase/N-acetylneuraminate lyase